MLIRSGWNQEAPRSRMNQAPPPTFQGCGAKAEVGPGTNIPTYLGRHSLDIGFTLTRSTKNEEGSDTGSDTRNP